MKDRLIYSWIYICIKIDRLISVGNKIEMGWIMHLIRFLFFSPFPPSSLIFVYLISYNFFIYSLLTFFLTLSFSFIFFFIYYYSQIFIYLSSISLSISLSIFLSLYQSSYLFIYLLIPLSIS